MTDTVPPGLRRFRMILWGLVIVAAIGATILYSLKLASGDRSVGALGVTGKPFAMESTAGGTFTQENLKGTPSLVFFGYTFCPDVCPTTLAESVAWKKAAGIGDDQLRTIFVTVDPERDTKQTVKEYLAGFDPDVIGLVGTKEQTHAIKASFGAMGEKDPDSSDPEFYLVSHTASVFLIGRDGSFEGTIAYGEDTNTAVAKIEKLVKG